MNQRDSMAPVLREITSTLRSGNSVWIVGSMAVVPAEAVATAAAPPPGLPTKWWLRPYLNYWSAQVMVHLLDHALQERVLEIPVNGPVNRLENLPVARFSGYKPDAD